MRPNVHHAILGISAALSLAGCSTLPRGAPTVSEVLPAADQGIAVIDIGLATPSGQPAAIRPLPPWAIADGAGVPAGVQPGDLIEITVFEVGYALFAGGGALSPSEMQAGGGGAATRFPQIRVPDDGTISLPYAGSLVVTGLSGGEIARRFETRLRGQSQNAQVVVSVESGPRRSIVVSGDVEEPGRIALTEAGERLLDAVALAGGPSARPEDTVVVLTRDGITARARLTDIADASSRNVLLAAGDRITLERNVRSITVLGAASSVSQVTIDQPELTLSEALARAGGPDADQADPTGVFVFRLESANDPSNEDAQRPVIYRLNLLDPVSYFAAQRFAMREQDVMLIADARSNRLDDFLRMVNALAAPIVTVDLLRR